MEANFRLAVVLCALGETDKLNAEFQEFSHLQADMECGASQGMERMLPHIPGFDQCNNEGRWKWGSV
jgi:hypothetical protein